MATNARREGGAAAGQRARPRNPAAAALFRGALCNRRALAFPLAFSSRRLDACFLHGAHHGAHSHTTPYLSNDKTGLSRRAATDRAAVGLGHTLGALASIPASELEHHPLAGRQAWPRRQTMMPC